MGLFFSSKKPAVSGNTGGGSLAHKFDRGSRGKITPRELTFVEKRLREEVGHHDAERIMEGLRPSLDSDGHLGGRNISKGEGDDALKYMEQGRYSGLSSHEIKKAQEILNEYE